MIEMEMPDTRIIQWEVGDVPDPEQLTAAAAAGYVNFRTVPDPGGDMHTLVVTKAPLADDDAAQDAWDDFVAWYEEDHR